MGVERLLPKCPRTSEPAKLFKFGSKDRISIWEEITYGNIILLYYQ